MKKLLVALSAALLLWGCGTEQGNDSTGRRKDGAEGVPPGTYRIKMWHEGVRLKQNIKSLQRYEYEEPYETTQDVTVQANGEAVVNFDLAMRSGT